MAKHIEFPLWILYYILLVNLKDKLLLSMRKITSLNSIVTDQIIVLRAEIN